MRPSTPGDGLDQRMPFRLPDAGEVLAVDEQPHPPELTFAEQADGSRTARFQSAYGLTSRRCAPGVIHLDADAADVFLLPHADQAGAVARRERDSRSPRRHRARAIARRCRCPSAQTVPGESVISSSTPVLRGALGIANRVGRVAIDFDRIGHPRHEQRHRCRQRTRRARDVE